MTKILQMIMTIGLVATAAFAANPEHTLKFSHVLAPGTASGKAAEFFAKRVNELTMGRVKVDVYPASELYNDTRVFKALKSGEVQIAFPSFSKFAPIVPSMELFDLPFLFEDADHVHRVMDGEVGQILKEKVKVAGYVPLNFWDSGFKQFTSNRQPVLTPEDAKGMRIRIMTSKVLEEQMRSMGANPQVLAYADVYFALDYGVVEAQENPLANILTKKFYEVQKYIALTNHGYIGSLIILSEVWWKNFPQDLKPTIIQAMKEATVHQRMLTAELEDKFLKTLQKLSLETGNFKIVKPNSEQKEALRQATRTIYPKFYDSIGEELVKKALK